MTLIAAFRAKGVPVLIGDFLLTTRQGPAGLRKKLRHLRPNLVVAWTGYEIVAEYAVGRLHAQLPEGRVSYDQLRAALAGLTEYQSDSKYVVLIGWLADDGERCFRWRSDFAHEMFEDDDAYEGTGESIVKDIVRSADSEPLTDSAKIEAALLVALYVSTRLMAYEAVDPVNEQGRTFGHAYEALYFDRGEFHYLDRVLYASAVMEFDGDGRFAGAELKSPVYRYRAREEVAVVDRYHGQQRQVFLNSAVGDPKRGTSTRILAEEYRALTRTRRIERTEYQCLFLQMISGTYVSTPGAFTQGPSNTEAQKLLTEDEKGNLSLRLPTTFITELYRNLRKHNL